MELGLKEKVIIVTGGGSGIGASVVNNLSLIGATPVIIDKSKPDDTFYTNIKSDVQELFGKPWIFVMIKIAKKQ